MKEQKKNQKKEIEIRKQTTPVIMIVAAMISLGIGMYNEWIIFDINALILVLAGLYIFELNEQHNEWKWYFLNSKLEDMKEKFESLDCHSKIEPCENAEQETIKVQTVKSQVIAPPDWIKNQTKEKENESIS